jgi:hypothetical protein
MVAALAVTVTLAGCSTSALIRPDDATFLHASKRLERTMAVVDASGASAGERALFLQAESFYRYRFEPATGRGGAAYAAEAAAAITDFPALQSLAGSMDLAELRLRAADAAVQLWETLLRRYPGSPLRPLALYRLAWAYKNLGASGMPRRSGDEALAELECEAPSSPLVQWTRAVRAVPTKSKDAAAAWSLFPGLGQFYVGEPLNGAVRSAVAVAALTAVVVPLSVAYRRRSELSWDHDWPLLATGFGGLVVLSIDYTTAYEDAMRGVVQWNERAEAAFERVYPDAP